MARLSKHGHILITLDYPDRQIALCSDRTILCNRGTGWKIYHRLDKHDDLDKWEQTMRTDYAQMPPEWHHYLAPLKRYAKALPRRVELDRLLNTWYHLLPRDLINLLAKYGFHITEEQAAELIRANRLAEMSYSQMMRRIREDMAAKTMAREC